MLDFVESAWYASAVFVSLYSFWGAVLISKNYILATGIEERRVEEAARMQTGHAMSHMFRQGTQNEWPHSSCDLHCISS